MVMVEANTARFGWSEVAMQNMHCGHGVVRARLVATQTDVRSLLSLVADGRETLSDYMSSEPSAKPTINQTTANGSSWRYHPTYVATAQSRDLQRWHMCLVSATLQFSITHMQTCGTKEYDNQRKNTLRQVLGLGHAPVDAATCAPH